MLLQEAGLLKKIYNDQLNPPVRVPLPRYKIDQPIDMTMMMTAFILMSIGLCFALLAFIKEYCGGRGTQVKVSLR